MPLSADPGARPDLSVVVVSWNTAGLLADCLASLERATAGLAVEVIVVDNASDDGSAEMVAAAFPAARLVRNAANVGFAAANNQGFAIARGEFVLLLNSDTLVHGNVLAASVAWMRARPDIGVFGPRVLNADGTVQPSTTGWPGLLDLLLMTSGLDRSGLPGVFDRYRMRRADRSLPADVDVVSGCAMFVRARAMEEVGPLDTAFFFYGEETDWCRRFRAAGWRVAYAPVGDITHFGGGSVRRLSHRRDVMLTEATVRLHAKHGGPAAALACRAILGAFNLSRAALWSLASIARAQGRARERARHFRLVCRDTLLPRRRAAA